MVLSWDIGTIALLMIIVNNYDKIWDGFTMKMVKPAVDSYIGLIPQMIKTRKIIIGNPVR